MDSTIDQIEDDIDRTRARLGSNIKELKDRVDAARDWRAHVRANPWPILGTAAAVGLLLGMTLRSHRG